MLVSEKLDVLGERHDQAVVDLQQSMSETHHIITERETEVAMLTERCGGTGHIFTGKCTQETERERAKADLKQDKVNTYSVFVTFHAKTYTNGFPLNG